MAVRLVAALTIALACVACGGQTEASSDRIAVPRLVGLTTETAVATVAGSGLCVGTISWGSYTPRMAGRVLSQQPLPGRRVRPLGRVSITIAPMGPSGDIVSSPTAAGCDRAEIIFPTPG